MHRMEINDGRDRVLYLFYKQRTVRGSERWRIDPLSKTIFTHFVFYWSIRWFLSPALTLILIDSSVLFCDEIKCRLWVSEVHLHRHISQSGTGNRSRSKWCLQIELSFLVMHNSVIRHRDYCQYNVALAHDLRYETIECIDGEWSRRYSSPNNVPFIGDIDAERESWKSKGSFINYRPLELD